MKFNNGIIQTLKYWDEHFHTWKVKDRNIIISEDELRDMAFGC